MTRSYECRNIGCSNFGIRIHVTPRPLDVYYELPNVICECGSPPPVVLINGEPIPD